jgi:hypothetical protein
MINQTINSSMLIKLLLACSLVSSFEIRTAFHVEQSSLLSDSLPTLAIRTRGLNAILVDSGFDVTYRSDVDDDDDLVDTIHGDDQSLYPTTTSYYGPPIGAKYESRISFPVLGTQRFSLHIQSRTEAHLVAAGRLSIDEMLKYSFDNINGKFSFQMSEKLKSTMKRFLTKLQEVGYDCHTDTPYVKVLPPLPTPFKIFLTRVNNSR